MSTIGDLVNNLFITHRKADGKEYTNQEVAEAIGATHSYIGKLRAGKISNPGRETLKNLSLFFGVPINYFFPELEAPAEPLMNPDDQLSLALRSSGLSSRAQRYIQGLFKLLRAQDDDDISS